MKYLSFFLLAISFCSFGKGVECKLINPEGKTLSVCQFSEFYSKRNNSHIKVNNCTLTGTKKERGDIRVRGLYEETVEEQSLITFKIESVEKKPIETILESDELGRYVNSFSQVTVDSDYLVKCNSFWEPKKLKK